MKKALSFGMLLALSTGCGNNGTIDGQLVLRCYRDGNITNDDGTVTKYREIYNEFSQPLNSEMFSTRVVGRLTQDNEFQLTTLLECKGTCEFQCATPPEGEEDNPIYAPIPVERLAFSFVVGRQESAGVDPANYPLYNPASYFAPGIACTPEEAATALATYELDVKTPSKYDDQAFMTVQMNSEQTREIYSDLGRSITYSSGEGNVDTYNADNGCYYFPWGSATISDVAQVVKGGAFEGTVYTSGLQLPFSHILVDITSSTSTTEPATYTVDGLIVDKRASSNVISENNDPWELGL